jgi:hypothetical protein
MARPATAVRVRQSICTGRHTPDRLGRRRRRCLIIPAKLDLGASPAGWFPAIRRVAAEAFQLATRRRE